MSTQVRQIAFLALLFGLFRCGAVAGAPEGTTELIKRLADRHIFAEWQSDEKGFSVAWGGGDPGPEEAKLINELQRHARVTRFYATGGSRSPSAEFFEALNEMPDVRRLAIGSINDERVLRALKVFRNATNVELLGVSLEVKDPPVFPGCTQLDFRMPFGEEAIQRLLEMPKLRALRIGLARGITVEGIVQLKKIKPLGSLELPATLPKGTPPSLADDVKRELGPSIKVLFLD